MRGYGSRVSHVVVLMAVMMSLLAGSLEAQTQDSAKRTSQLAATPPMGWNSWDSYGLRITEQQFRDNVEALTSRLQKFGYGYAVIDEGWYFRNPEDRPHPELLKMSLDNHGRFIPVPERFPSAMESGENTGFRAMGQWVHSKGLKFGIHVIRGIPREGVKQNAPIEGSSYTVQDAADQSDSCPWDPTSWGVKDTPAGQAWYDALIRQYAEWGVDFLKVDCISDHPYKQSEIRQIHLAIQRSGRPMVLSLSPGPTNVSHAAEVGSLSQMWRISNDVWDVWSSNSFPIGIRNQFENAALWAPYAHAGNWPDADMLPVGELRPYPDVGGGARHTRLTPAEQRTQISLWAFARSPLIVGANLTLLDDATERLLTNREIIRIDQAAMATRQVSSKENIVIWTADMPGGAHAIGIFNTGETPAEVNDSFSTLKLPSRNYHVQDVWSGKSKVGASLNEKIAPHDAVVLMLKP